MPRFAFDLASPLTLPLQLTGIGPRLASVRIENGILDVRFGLLRLRTPVANVSEATVTGPYNPLRSLGVHVSLADLGLTFGTTHRHGLCIEFVRPVSGVLPVPFLAHPGLTVTVADPGLLQDTLLTARDDAVAEQQRLIAGHSRVADPAAARHRASRDVAPAGTTLEVVRPTETAVRPVRELADRAGTSVDAIAAERVVPAANGTPASTSAPRNVPAKKAAAKKTAPAKGAPAKRPAAKRVTPAPTPTPADRATRTVGRELSARRPAGNLPDE